MGAKHWQLCCLLFAAYGCSTDIAAPTIQDCVSGLCDGDHDGVRDRWDNCPAIKNETQSDRDGDGLGDACDLRPESGDYSADHQMVQHPAMMGNDTQLLQSFEWPRPARSRNGRYLMEARVGP